MSTTLPSAPTCPFHGRARSARPHQRSIGNRSAVRNTGAAACRDARDRPSLHRDVSGLAARRRRHHDRNTGVGDLRAARPAAGEHARTDRASNELGGHRQKRTRRHVEGSGHDLRGRTHRARRRGRLHPTRDSSATSRSWTSPSSSGSPRSSTSSMPPPTAGYIRKRSTTPATSGSQPDSTHRAIPPSRLSAARRERSSWKRPLRYERRHP